MHSSHVCRVAPRRACVVLPAMLFAIACHADAAPAYGSGPPHAMRQHARSARDSARSFGRIGYEFNNVPWIGQAESPWGSLQYGDDADCSTFAVGGCGPTAFAMVLRHYGWDVDPTDVGALAVATRARACPGGTDAGNEQFLSILADRYHADVATLHRGHRDVLELLRAGQPVIAVGPSAGYTSRHRYRSYSGHFIVLTGIDHRERSRGRQTIVRVNDPGNSDGVGIAYMTITQLRRMHRFVTFHPRAFDKRSIAVAAGREGFNTPVRCPALDELRRQQPLVVARGLDVEAWLAYGRALAACGPDDQPWESLRLSGGREQFIDEYLAPFLNGDVLLGSPFSRREPEHYSAIVRTWRLDG